MIVKYSVLLLVAEDSFIKILKLFTCLAIVLVNVFRIKPTHGSFHLLFYLQRLTLPVFAAIHYHILSSSSSNPLDNYKYHRNCNNIS